MKFGPPGWYLSLRADIGASRLELGGLGIWNLRLELRPCNWKLGLEAGIGAWRIGLGLEARIWDGKLGFGP